MQSEELITKLQFSKTENYEKILNNMNPTPGEITKPQPFAFIKLLQSILQQHLNPQHIPSTFKQIPTNHSLIFLMQTQYPTTYYNQNQSK